MIYRYSNIFILYITRSFFYVACLRMVSNGQQTDFGVKAILGTADYCHAALSTSVWPAWQFCNLLTVSWTTQPLTVYYGVDCTRICYFGRVHAGACRCSKGVWGEQCNDVCPGGLISTCNNRGICIKSNGECICDANWRGSKNCTQCSRGFTGIDCSLSILTNKETELHSSAVFGEGFTRTFDGARVRLNSTGELLMYRSSDAKVEAQTRMVRRRRSVVLDAAAVRVGNESVALVSKPDGNVSVAVNGEEIDENRSVNFTALGYQYERKTHDSFAVSGPGGLLITFYRRNFSLDLELTMSRSFCSGAIGVLGTCNLTDPSGNGIILQYNATSFTESDLANYTMRWDVPPKDSLIQPALNATSQPSFITSAGCCIYLDGVGIVTSPLTNVFRSSYISLQIMFKVRDVHKGSSLLSLGRNKTLSVVINGTLLIHYQNKRIDTEILVESGKWLQLSLVYQRMNKVMQVFICSSTTLIRQRVFIVNDSDWFEEGSRLGIGLWIASLDSPVDLRLSNFVGWVDDVRIWTKRLDAITIQALWGKDISESESNLAAIWKFNEASGSTVEDGIGQHDILLTEKDSLTLQWVAADYQTSASTVYTSAARLSERRAAAQSHCSGVIYSEAMNKTCLSIVGEGVGFYFASCVEEFTSSQADDVLHETLLAYSVECKSVANLSEDPGRVLCNILPGGHFSNWYGKDCSKRCIYGTVNKLNEFCSCDRGYWGVRCDKTCPGGATNPCHRNGICDVKTGSCLCDANFNGSYACDKCSNGWFGRNCKYVVEKVPADINPFCVVDDTGEYFAFDRLRFDISKVGRYILMKDNNMTVYVDHVFCYKQSLCINNVYIQENDLMISFGLLKENKLTLKVGSVIITGLKPEGMIINGTWSLRLTDQATYRMQVRNSISLQVKLVKNFLKVRLISLNLRCVYYSGVCGACISTPDLSETRFKPFGTVRFTNYALRSLYFEGATIYSEKLFSIGGPSITFDFLVKSCAPVVCGGPIVTYSSKVSFSISNYISIRIYIGSEIYDTGLSTEKDKWNQVFVSLSEIDLKMDVYVVSSSFVVSYRTFKLRSYPIANGGILAVGSWMPTLKKTSLQPEDSFKGEIDELKLWSRKFYFSSIKKYAFFNPSIRIPQLAAAWKFDEEAGNFTFDLVNGIRLRLPLYPWKKPTWRFSDAPLLYPSSRGAVDDSSIRKQGLIFCTDLLLKGPMGLACSLINEGEKQFYMKQCLSVIIRTRQVSSALSTAIHYADHCQAILKLKKWPAQLLCNRFSGRRFPNWIGDDCSVQCVHGSKDESDAYRCVCDFGFWGTSCNETCPGGFVHPCSDHGICDVELGNCFCEQSWRGDSNCSRCSVGLTGTGCDLVDVGFAVNISAYIAQVGFQGAVVMFGQIGFTLRKRGEYILLFSSKFKVSLHARFIPCFSDSVCLVAVSAKVKNHQVVIRAPLINSGNLLIWLNGKMRDIYQQPVLHEEFGFTLSQKLMMTLELKMPLGLVTFTISGKYMTLEININSDVCLTTVGLLGHCGPSREEVFGRQVTFGNCTGRNFTGETVMTGKPIGLELLTSSVLGQYLTQFVLKECDSLFVFVYNGIVEYREGNAGYALLINGTALTVMNCSLIGMSDFLTIDFMVNVVKQGTILSCGYEAMFLLAVEDNTIYVAVNNIKYSLTLGIEMNAWNQIILQWDRNQRLLGVSIIYVNGTLARDEIVANAELFTKSSILAFGQWQPAMNESNLHPNGTFLGYIDEVKIWSRLFSPALIWQLKSRKVKIDSDGLLFLFELNEGEGSKFVDKRSGHIQNLVESPWKRPDWVFSNLVLTKQPRTRTREEIERNSRESVAALRTCEKLIKSDTLSRLCHGVGKGRITSFLKSCYEIVLETRKVAEGLKIVVMYADYCMYALNLTVWPAHGLCRQFTKSQMPMNMYDKCNKVCLYGAESGNGTCVCFKGYWGSNCSFICPAGALNPCNNNGQCNQKSGFCECYVNWNGSTDCGSCSFGWSGPDCSIALISNISFTKQFFVSGGILGLFDGATIEFSYTGRFLLLKHASMHSSIELFQMPCQQVKMCIKAVAIKLESRVLVLTVALNNSPLKVFLDNRLISLSSALLTIKGSNSSMDVQYFASLEISVRIRGSFGIRIRFFEKEISLSVGLTGLSCNSLQGMMAYCAINAWNTTSAMVAKDLYRQFALSEKISDIPTSIIPNNEHNEGEYALHFNNTMAVTSTLCKSVVENSDLTVELLLRPYTNNGVLLSYAKRTVIGLFMKKTFKLNVDTHVLDTGINIALGHWFYIAIVWNQQLYRLEVFIKKDDNPVQRRTFYIPFKLISRCGLLSLGNWLPSYAMLPPPVSGAAIFTMDEIRIWNRVFDAVTIQQNFKLNVISSYQSLTGLWKFNEGNGHIAENLITNEHLYLPWKFAKRPQWVMSSAKLESVFNSLARPPDTVSRDLPIVERYCKSLFYSGPLLRNCPGVDSFRDLSFSSCIRDVTSNKNNKSLAVLSVVNFADQCQVLLNLSYWPARPLCTIFSGQRFPYWIGDYCEVPCIFGHAKPDNKSQCVCDAGFWGMNCTEECPGGAANPCSRNGACDKRTGICECKANWNKDSNCSTCKEGWSGEFCDIVNADENYMSCAFMPGGNAVTLNGTSRRVLNAGEFHLLKMKERNVTVNVLQERCNSDLILCATALSLQVETNTIKVFASSNGKLEPEIYVNDVQTSLATRSKRVDGISIYLESSNRVKLSLIALMEINIRLMLGELSIQVKVEDGLCRGSQSICGSCHAEIDSNYTNIYAVYAKGIMVSHRNLVLSKDISLTNKFRFVFSGVGLSTNVLTDVYMNENMSIDIRFTPDSRALQNSTLICFSNDDSFAIIIRKTLHVVVSTAIHDTGFVVNVDLTNQVSIVYEYTTRKMVIYFTNAAGLTWFYRLRLPYNMVLLGRFGVLSIGQWISSKETKHFLPASGYSGTIDTVRIWKRLYSYLEVRALFHSQIDLNDPDLVSSWDFNEGSGNVVYDPVSKVDLYIPADSKAPRWIISTVSKRSSIQFENLEFPSKVFEKKAKELCNWLMFGSNLSQNCVKLGKPRIG